MKVLIVDDHILFREGLGSLLRSQPGYIVVGEAGTAAEAIQKAEELVPDLVLLDIHLPDGSGLDAVKAILCRSPETKVVMLTAHEGDELIFQAIASGAKGYLMKNTPVTTLLASLKALQSGEAALSRKMAAQVIDNLVRRVNFEDKLDEQVNLLTPRELDVLQELAQDATNLEIAQRLVISENTVKIHVSKILEKLHLQNRYEAGRVARRYQMRASRT